MLSENTKLILFYVLVYRLFKRKSSALSRENNFEIMCLVVFANKTEKWETEQYPLLPMSSLGKKSKIFDLKSLKKMKVYYKI